MFYFHFKTTKEKIMKKIIITMFLTFSISLSGNAGCLKNFDNELIITKAKLQKYNCEKVNNTETEKFCKKNEPKAKFYSKKLKIIKKEVLKCLS